MRLINDINVGLKLAGSYVFMAGTFAVLAWFAIDRLGASRDAGTAIYEHDFVAVRNGGDLMELYRVIGLAARDAILTRDAGPSTAWLTQIDGEIRTHLATIEAAVSGDAQAAAFRRATTALASYRQAVTPILSLVSEGKVDEARALLSGALETKSNEANEALDALCEIFSDAAKGAAAKNVVDANEARKLLYAIVAAVGLLSVIAGPLFALSITRPLDAGVKMMKEMAKGHLGLRLKLDRRDELGVVARAMDDFADELAGVVNGLQRIAAGDLGREFEAHDAQDEINPALMKVTETLRGMSADAQMLSKAAVEGRLATRADAGKYQGAYHQIIQGVNETLDAVVGPVNAVMRVMGTIEQGDLTSRVTQQYQGDFQHLAQVINNSTARLGQTLAAVARPTRWPTPRRSSAIRRTR